MRIWILNPFDQLPNETDVPLRYWSLCTAFATQGHEVTWWSSDFSHLTKSKRAPCPDTDGFAVRLIETPPYTKNISFARLKNHKAFADGFYRDALAALQSGELEAPDRIVVSLPPLGIAEQAFKIRDFIHPSSAIHHPTTTAACEVVVDIMDAWPETFYQALPKPLRKLLGPLLLAPLHRSARRAYQGADKITAVGQSYLDLVKSYGADTPLHRCYHGAELSRFSKDYNDRLLTHAPLKAVYMGAMGFGYDLQSLVEVAARWKAENRFPAQIHFAGDGPQREALATRASELGLIADPTVGIKDSSRIIFHGQLGRDAVNKLLGSADLALVPNRPSTLVACPYKAGEYAAAGLPMISCLTGELNQLLSEWHAGSKYTEGDTDSLHAAFENYLTNTELLNQHSQNARKMAEALFDRNQTYAALTEFMLDSSQH